MAKEFTPVVFPRDESVHETAVEWWYFNGNLKDADGNEFSFMNCLFKVNTKKAKIPFLSRMPLETAAFSHSLLTDVTNKKFYHRMAPISLISGDSFSKPNLYINYLNPGIKGGYVNCVIEKTAEEKYALKNEDIDLVFNSVKKPLLEDGAGYVDLVSQSTYYYSLTHLETEGRVKIDGHWVSVTGKSWMDHQWVDGDPSHDRWDWFSIQLNNSTEIVCYAFGKDEARVFRADISYADGRQESLKDIKITPGEKHWTGSKSMAAYPMEWQVSIPSKGIELRLAAKVEEQEMLFGSLNYWEGPATVVGRFGEEEVRGDGFMELVGYASKYSDIKYLRDEAEEVLGKLVATAKGKVFGATPFRL
jgi:predicted secreted hydrolase